MIKLHVSLGNRKLGKIPSVSFPPVMTCKPSAPCFKACYAMKAYRQYPNVRTALTDNLELWRTDPKAFKAQFWQWLEKHKPAYFRYHVSGDIPDYSYFIFMLMTAIAFPDIQFLAYTKRDDILTELPNTLFGLPKNLTLRQSIWLNESRSLPLPVAGVRDNQGNISNMPTDVRYTFICGGSCVNCKQCWSREHSILFDMH